MAAAHNMGRSGAFRKMLKPITCQKISASGMSTHAQPSPATRKKCCGTCDCSSPTHSEPTANGSPYATLKAKGGRSTAPAARSTCLVTSS